MATRLCQAKKVEISTKKAMPIQIDGEPQEWGPGQVQCTRSTHKRGRALAPRTRARVPTHPQQQLCGLCGGGRGGRWGLHCFVGCGSMPIGLTLMGLFAQAACRMSRACRSAACCARARRVQFEVSHLTKSFMLHRSSGLGGNKYAPTQPLSLN